MLITMFQFVQTLNFFYYLNYFLDHGINNAYVCLLFLHFLLKMLLNAIFASLFMGIYLRAPIPDSSAVIGHLGTHTCNLLIFCIHGDANLLGKSVININH